MCSSFLQLLLLLLLLLQQTACTATPPPPSQQQKFACQPPHNSFPFCNTSLPILTRAKSLVSLLTLPEKTHLLSDNATAILRLGIPAYEWWAESVHGIATDGPAVSFGGGKPIPAATSFPQVILTASSFNRTLWSSIARAIAVEARAMYNSGQAGLTFWAPNINIFRDPRWGRGQETPGEDPLVASSYAVEYAIAFQGKYSMANETAGGSTVLAGAAAGVEEKRVLQQGPDESSGLMLSACCKHYIAYDLENWRNFTRYTFNAKVTEQDMEDTYQPPFRSCIQDGGATCLMCSYNELNGVPICADGELLRKAREDWGLRGYITSDCNAVATIYEYQNYTQDPVDAVADAIKAGVDINCGGYYSLYAQSAVESGKIKEEDIDQALLNLFSVQLRLGLFDGEPASQRFGRLGPSNVCTAEHRQLALDAARQSIVLLKNDQGFLPLRRRNATKAMSVAVIGPMVNVAKLDGNYAGVPCNEKSLVEGLQDLGNVSFASGCMDGVQCSSADGFGEAVWVAREAELVVVVVGLDKTQEGEDLDRESLLLPGKQVDLVKAVAGASQRPVILILIGGGPMDVSFAKEDRRIGSILWVGYPGELGAQAIAEAIAGNFNPGGRLPMTWYPESFTAVPMNDMHMRPDSTRGYPGRTYKFYTGPVVYGFGYGLSYSNFTYRFTSAPPRISLSMAAKIHQQPAKLWRDNSLEHIGIEDLAGSCGALKFTVHILVINEGAMDGSHVVLLFAKPRTGLKGAPQKQLVGFERVQTVASRATEVAILLDPCKHLSTANEKGERVLPLGVHVLMLEGGAERSLNIEI